MIRMDEMNKIRKAFYIDGLCVNEISQKFKRSWGTVNEIVKTPRDDLENYDKQVRKRESTVATQEVIDAIESYLEKEIKLGVKKKQRYRANVIFKELTAKGIYKGSQRRMQELVKKARDLYGQIEPKSYLPLEFTLGSTLQMDHGEVDCIIAGSRMTCFLFIGTVPGTTLRYCQLFGTKAQESWGEFHERCFCFYKGIFLRVIYDNDTVLIKDAAKGKHVETNFSLALCEHYGFTSVYCNPASGNEKGSVENGVGFCRRNYLPGCPSYGNFDEVNEYLEQQCLEEIAKSPHARNGKSAQTILEELGTNLKPLLPTRKWRQRSSRHVNSYQMVEVHDHFYSVPEKFVESYVRIAVGAFIIEIYNKEELVYEHIRIFVPGVDSLLLDHYLDQLRKKPGALWDCKATKGILDDKALESIWGRLLERNPQRKAQKDFIEILYLKKKYKEEDWKAAIEKALKCGAYDPAAIESIIQMLITPDRSGDEKAVQEQLRHIPIPVWECNLSEYAMLSKGGITSEKASEASDLSHLETTHVLNAYDVNTSSYGNAMQGKWNAPIADQIIDDYLHEIKNTQHAINEKTALQMKLKVVSLDGKYHLSEYATLSRGGDKC
jgi:transposase